MPEESKPAPESDHDWMREALEEEERSEHGLPSEPPADDITPTDGVPSP